MFGGRHRRCRPSGPEQGHVHAGRHGSLRLQRGVQGHHRQGDPGTRAVLGGRGEKAHQGRQFLWFLHRAGRTDSDQHRGRRGRRPKSEKAICGCSDLNHGQVRKAIREHHLISIPAAMAFMEWRTPNGCATCRPALKLPDLHLAGRGQDDPQSRFINERAHANIQKDGTSVVPRMWGGVTRRAATHRRCGGQVPGADGQGHRRPAHRPAGYPQGRPAGRLERPGHAFRPRLRQIHPHREDLRRQRVLPLRHAELDADGHRPGTRAVQHVVAAQGQAGRLRLPAQLRRIRHQGRRHHRCGLRLGAVHRRQRRHQDRRPASSSSR